MTNLALQQFEDAAEQIAAVKRSGDEVVAIGVGPPRPPRDIAGKQRFEPGLARPELTHRGGAVERPGQLYRGEHQCEAAAARGADCRKTFRDGGDRKSLLAKDAGAKLPASLIAIDDEYLLRFRVHLLPTHYNPVVEEGYGPPILLASLIATLFV